MADDAVATTRHEELSKNFDAVVAEAEKVEAPATDAAPEAAEAPEAVAETPQGRTAGRKRDEQGRLLPGKPEKDAVAAAPKADTAPAQASGEQAAPATAPVKARPARPSTWKKEMWGHWEKIDPDLAEYLTQRESQFASGVSTYKAEYDRVKPLDEALKPYAPYFQQAGVRPEQAVTALMQNHNALTYGTPEQKLQQFARLAQDYQIPLHQLLVQGEDGKVYLNQQYFQQQQNQQQPQGVSLQDVQRLLHQERQVAQVQAAVAQFTAAKDGSGNPLYPHFDAVKDTMDGLLRAGLAQDLPSAYEASLRMPQHTDLFEAQQTAKRESEQAAAKQAKQEQAARARAAAVSTRSQAPTGGVATANKGGKSRLEELSANFDEIVGTSGRV